jgi:hypothetical protein
LNKNPIIKDGIFVLRRVLSSKFIFVCSKYFLPFPPYYQAMAYNLAIEQLRDLRQRHLLDGMYLLELTLLYIQKNPEQVILRLMDDPTLGRYSYIHVEDERTRDLFIELRFDDEFRVYYNDYDFTFEFRLSDYEALLTKVPHKIKEQMIDLYAKGNEYKRVISLLD